MYLVSNWRTVGAWRGDWSIRMISHAFARTDLMDELAAVLGVGPVVSRDAGLLHFPGRVVELSEQPPEPSFRVHGFTDAIRRRSPVRVGRRRGRADRADTSTRGRGPP